VEDHDAEALAAHTAKLAHLLENWHAADLLIYRSVFLGVLARLFRAAGEIDRARETLDTALASSRDTGMCFYDAELMRLRAGLESDPDARRAGVAAARDLARTQDAPLFELRPALDAVDLGGEPARAALRDVIGRFPADSVLPELARAREILAQN
jgi:predicted ATPase